MNSLRAIGSSISVPVRSHNSSGVVSSDGRDALYVSYYIRKP